MSRNRFAISPDQRLSPTARSLTQCLENSRPYVQVSRALADRRLADEVLEQGVQNALALLGGRASRRTRLPPATYPSAHLGQSAPALIELNWVGRIGVAAKVHRAPDSRTA